MHGYRIIHFLSLFNILSTLLKCKECENDVEFKVKGEQGLGFKLLVECDCGSNEIDSCPKINNKAFEINRRIVFAMRVLGVGLQGINIFCGLMDLGQGLSTNIYYSCLANVWIAAKAVFEIVIRKAASEEKEKNAEAGNEPSHLSVSGDGTWSKRGFSSFGVVTLIGKYSNKLLDLIVKFSFCQACNYWRNKDDITDDELQQWYEAHEENCACNHSGSAGKLEVDGIIEMFTRSDELHNVKYVNYIGDGDTKTFKALLESQPYGDQLIGGKGPGKLIDSLIKDLTIYYGLSIIRNSNSVNAMKDAIWATFYHKYSTDENPQHEKCPPGADLWCKWRQAEINNTLSEYKHPAPLTSEAQEILRPIYEHLSSADLLERCLGGHIQNNNESFNAVLWKFAPKHIFSSAKIIEISSFLATCIFNEGFVPLLQIMEGMGIKLGINAKIMADRRDERRFRIAEKRATAASKEARLAHRLEQCTKNELYEEEEGILYGPGIAD
ncbi:hypothetical protein X777_16489 [Ooceraea biroi]|uniref:Mutator-like transposase domain-containing protein n=1 Tax=Ooceraea biroi TaxID=2015173 RepID=A0A026VU21_OOCBI|nr:hypothetical protein X777_16489 [Ooceraea biroi]